MFHNLLLVLSTFYLLIYDHRSVRALPATCSVFPSITFQDGQDVSRIDNIGVFVFSPLQCSSCYGYLKTLNDIARRYRMKFIIIAPDFESNHIISRTSSAFGNLRIDRSREGWSHYSARNFDTILIDSCGRLIDTIRSPSSDGDTNRILVQALDQFRSGTSTKKCGQCSGQVRLKTNQPSAQQKVNAYIQEKELREYNRQTRPQPPVQNTYNYQHQARRPPIQPSTSYSDPRWSVTQPPTIRTVQTAPPSTTKQPVTLDDYYDYYDNKEEKKPMTTVSPQTQIVRPPQSDTSINWPTPPTPPYYQNQYYQEGFRNGVHHQQRVKAVSALAAAGLDTSSNLPCSAFTDDICFQQQERLGDTDLISSMPSCCNKGVYLTDVCVPGKCSNTTTQLCCFQKFLQARYTCCSDANQDDETTPTNKFNKCCHSNFVVEEDPCCTKETASKYWKSVYEVCYPTTFVNYSSIRFEARFTEGVRVIDLSVNNQWDFKCHHGGHRLQYAYLP